ncbi:MAG TPA: hypothetical protein PK090_00380 [Smithellaceae bacterium]|nr:hypothetical protein [Smithellaceae bacterium]
MKRDMPSCGGCRTCEMICSFHHTGAYNPSLSSIKILEKTTGAGYNVLLLKEDGPAGRACDRCRGLARPLCLDVCREESDLTAILDEFFSLGDREKQPEGTF